MTIRVAGPNISSERALLFTNSTAVVLNTDGAAVPNASDVTLRSVSTLGCAFIAAVESWYALQIPALSIVAAGTLAVSSMNFSVNASAPSAGMKKTPGLVQNCPTPRVRDAEAAVARFSAALTD